MLLWFCYSEHGAPLLIINICGFVFGFIGFVMFVLFAELFTVIFWGLFAVLCCGVLIDVCCCLIVAIGGWGAIVVVGVFALWFA